LLLDLPRQAGLKWDALIQITGCAEIYRELHPSPGPTRPSGSSSRTSSNPSSSARRSLHARESIRTTRDIVPSEAWRSINELCMYVGQELDAVDVASAPLRHSLARRRGCQQISGLLARHDEPRLGLSVLPRSAAASSVPT
jgi:uncharacterized alpha-E superfamily protein